MGGQGPEIKVTDARRVLVERVAASSYFHRSARLRDLLMYLTDRVLEDEAVEIHEQEVGNKVFGRPWEYDTAADNIVRVHASMLRKRLEQYFAAEGAGENLILEIPKGNYAPVFRERAKPAPIPLQLETLPRPSQPRWDLRLMAAVACAVLFACSTAVLLWRGPARAVNPMGPTARMFWSQILRPDRATDIVTDDAAVALYQELTGHPLSLAEYFDRSYQRSIPAAAQAAGLNADLAASLVLRRQSSFADTSFSWKLLQLAAAGGMRANLRFARDYTFRDIKADNAILLGNSRSNPWVQSFEPRLGIRWQFEKGEGVYYPVDTWQGNRSYLTGAPGEPHDGYFSIAFLPNLGDSGKILILAATGGSASNAAADFLADERSVADLRRHLPETPDHTFPPFEALVKAKGRSAVSRDVTLVLCRPVK